MVKRFWKDRVQDAKADIADLSVPFESAQVNRVHIALEGEGGGSERRSDAQYIYLL